MAISKGPASGSLKADTKTLKSLWVYIWPKDFPMVRVRLIWAFSFLVAAKIANIIVPYVFKVSVDTLAPSGLSESAAFLLSVPFWIILGYAALRVMTTLFTELQTALFAKITQRAVRQAAQTIFQYLHALSLRFHLDRQTGGLSRAIERGIRGIESLMQFLTFNIIPTIIEICLVGGVLWGLYGFKFMFVTIITLFGYIFFTLYMTEKRIEYIRQMNATDNDAHTKAIDSLLNYETVKYFGNEKHEEVRFDESLQKYEKSAIKSKISLSYLNVGQSIIISIGLAIAMIMAGMSVVNGTMTIGDFVAVNVYVIQLYIPLFNLGFAYREVKMSLVNMEFMFSLLKVPREVKDSPKSRPLTLKRGGVTFKDVDFHYSPDRKILSNISFKVPAGKTVAIVGASGSGKSTISRLLFRFYDVTQGSIKIDGQDIRDVKQTTLRQAIGIVPQDTVLFNDTIRYNIGYGDPSATEEDIIEAAKHARIHDFIESLPKGYNTTVGERGLKLSGGEKQRVAIARTLLKKPQIFLFDEATSALDSRTEKQIQRSLQELSQNHTTLIIAHRLSTVIDSDEILVLDHGKIIERGTHTALLSHNEIYAKMWRRQQRSGSSDSSSQAKKGEPLR